MLNNFFFSFVEIHSTFIAMIMSMVPDMDLTRFLYWHLHVYIERVFLQLYSYTLV